MTPLDESKPYLPTDGLDKKDYYATVRMDVQGRLLLKCPDCNKDYTAKIECADGKFIIVPDVIKEYEK